MCPSMLCSPDRVPAQVLQLCRLACWVSCCAGAETLALYYKLWLGTHSWVTRPFSHWMPVQGTGLPQGLLLRPDTPPDPVLESVMPGTPAAARAASWAAMAAVTELELLAPPFVTPQPMMKPLPAEFAWTQAWTGAKLPTVQPENGSATAADLGSLAGRTHAS